MEIFVRVIIVTIFTFYLFLLCIKDLLILKYFLSVSYWIDMNVMCRNVLDMLPTYHDVHFPIRVFEYEIDYPEEII